MDDQRLEPGSKSDPTRELVLSLAHELRSPLVRLRGFLELSRTHIPDYAAVMLEDVEYIEGLLRELTLPLPVRAMGLFRLYPLLQSVRFLLASKAEEKGISVQLRFERSALLAKLYGDEKRMKLAFLNLLRLALDTAPEGGELIVRLRAKGSRVSIGLTFPVMAGAWPENAEEAPPGMRIAQRIFEEHGGTLRVRGGSEAIVVEIDLLANKSV